MIPIDKKWKLKRRLEDYLWRGRAPKPRIVRAALEKMSLNFDHVGIIGGLIRDIALGGGKNFQSDVDLVIDAPPNMVSDYALKIQAKPNKFGGFSSIFGNQKVDFWAISETWTYKNGWVDVPSLSEVPSSTFFILDAAVYDINTRNLYLHDEYVNNVNELILEINVRANPSELGNLVRAIRRILKENLIPGHRLGRFLLENLSESHFKFVIAKEVELYRYSYANEYNSNVDLLKALFSRHSRKAHRQEVFSFVK